MKLLNTPMGVAPSGRRPWLRWVALAVFVVALAIAFVNLGRWQLDRLDQRHERNSAVVEHESGPLREFADVFNRPITEADQWQRVRVRGTYDAANQFLVRYRVQGADSGYEIVTPLQATWGIHDLVNETMAAAARTHIAEHGGNPRTAPVVAFGGAGPVHAYGLASKLGAPQLPHAHG